MNIKGELTAGKWITGLLLVSLIFIGYTSVIGDLQTNYNFEVSEDWQDAYSKFDAVQDNQDILEFQNQTTGASSSWISTTPIIGTFYSWGDKAFSTIGGALTTMSSTYNVGEAMINEVSETGKFGLDNRVTQIVLTILSLTVLFIIIGYLFRRNFN